MPSTLKKWRQLLKLSSCLSAEYDIIGHFHFLESPNLPLLSFQVPTVSKFLLVVGCIVNLAKLELYLLKYLSFHGPVRWGHKRYLLSDLEVMHKAAVISFLCSEGWCQGTSHCCHWPASALRWCGAQGKQACNSSVCFQICFFSFSLLGQVQHQTQ